MTTRTTILLITALGLALAALPTSARSAQALFIESPSKYGFAESVKRLQAAAKKGGWKVPKVFNLQGAMKKAGHKVLPVTVVAVCKPALAVKILGDDARRPAAAMMPCKVAVYEKADGKTYFSRVNAAALRGSAPGGAGAAMVEAGKGLERLLKPLIKK
jgi:uncharacterized protein (DUF302 family)